MATRVAGHTWGHIYGTCLEALDYRLVIITAGVVLKDGLPGRERKAMHYSQRYDTLRPAKPRLAPSNHFKQCIIIITPCPMPHPQPNFKFTIEELQKIHTRACDTTIVGTRTQCAQKIANARASSPNRHTSGYT